MDLSDGRAYCGTGTVTTESSGSSMVVSLQVPSTTYGGRFYCTATKINCQCGMSRKVSGTGGVEGRIGCVINR